MGTTTNRGYPYPEPTDPVAAGAAAIEALAEAVDADTGNALHRLPYWFGRTTSITASNLACDGVERYTGVTGFSAPAPIAGQVIVLWSFHYSANAVAGRVQPSIKHGSTPVVAVNQSYSASEFGSMTIVGSYAVAAGADCNAAFYITSANVPSGTITFAGDAIGFLIGTG